MSDFKEGDKVRVTFDCEVSWVDGDFMEGTADGYVFPLQLTGGVTVVPADEPDRFERALQVMARHVAESNAAASRCDNPRDAGIAIEYRTEADAVLCSLVDVIVAGGVEDRDEARAQAYKLIAEAAKSRG